MDNDKAATKMTRWQCDDVDYDATAFHDGDYGEMIK